MNKRSKTSAPLNDGVCGDTPRRSQCSSSVEGEAKLELETLREALLPLPPSALPAMLLAHATAARGSDVMDAAQQLLEKKGLGEVDAKTVQFVYGKIRDYAPDFLMDLPAFSPPPVLLEPVMSECKRCRQDFDKYEKRIPMDIYSSRRGLFEAAAVERHCSQCDRYFVGNLTFFRRDMIVQCVSQVVDISQQDLVVAFSGRRGYRLVAMFQHDLKKTSGILHHARGSFQAATEILVEESGCPRMGKKNQEGHMCRRVVMKLWVWYALATFLGSDASGGLDWSTWLLDEGPSSDEWLYEQRHAVRTRFLDKWLLQHVVSCNVCSVRFGLGLDGKRGMKRAVCACLQSSSLHIPEMDAWRCQPCHRLPLKGGLYCKIHDEDPGDGAEVCDDSADCEVVAHRQVEGDLQYKLVERHHEGDGRAVWVAASDVAASAIRAYEVARLPMSSVQGNKKKKQAKRRTKETIEMEGDDVLRQTQDDVGLCEIEKDKQGLNQTVQKWRRRRIGGILAAVSGCRIFLDWREHHGGEGSGEIYQLLAGCVSHIRQSQQSGGPGKQPDVVFFDNACALLRFARNPKRADRTAITKIIRDLHFILDIWHRANHVKCLQDPVLSAEIDPRHANNEDLRGVVNTEACEQAFSFLDRYTYMTYSMGAGLFHVYVYLLLDMENSKLMRHR